ncbi:integrase core domain-containing protein [Streptomyces sp. NPDC048279]|uniref:integrase core domain-containing protein n=1 Tax=Streptomyces sp. NPDC048279 TaxID=3154714 RepID=UPI00343FABBE
MRAAVLGGAGRGRKVRTTVPGKDGRRAGDLVNCDFHAPGPDRLWVADFTYVPCWAGIAPSIGGVAYAHDNALAEWTIGLFKTELINRRGRWKTSTDVEFATAEGIDWYNHRRLHRALGHTAPAEFKTAYHHQHIRADEPVRA